MPLQKSKTLRLRSDRMEFQDYKDSSFPVDVYEDRFSDFARAKLPCHWHDVVELDYMAAGKVTYYIDSEAVTLKAGDLLVICPGQMHLAQATDLTSLALGFTFDPKLIAGSEMTLLYRTYFTPLIKNFPYLTVTDQVCGDCMKQIHQMDRSDPLSEWKILENMVRIWGRILALQKDVSGRSAPEHSIQRSAEMKTMLNYIRDHYSEKLQVADLCRAGSVSRSECFRLFEKYSLFSPMEYLSDYRLNAAALLLTDTDRSVADIAQQCGFETASYFSQQFKRHFGMTPVTYRRR